MPIVQFTRFKTDKAEEMVQLIRRAKKIFEKHGAEFLRLSRFHTGAWTGELLVATRYSSWGGLRQSAGGRGKGPGVCAGAG
ncbi:hypothetical protein ACVWWR_007604 [Bradyrhizobium sp. LM3.2]